ncbi:MAG: hypothetical protein J6T10_22440 [Methanobrevibacter sp.]|nr:hypothetical protein [Methanobrevibacter sp.]
MPKTNKEQIIKLCNEINKKEGKGSIYTIGSDAANLKISRWKTGIEDLDSIIGGGMPEGRIIEIFGPESSGKTTLAYHLCGLHNLCLDIPIEGCVDCDTEFFNGMKWKKISEYKEGEKVLQYNPDGTAEMVLPEKFHKYEAKTLWQVYSRRMDMVISEYHNVVYYTTSKNPKLMIKPFHDIRIACENNKQGFCGNIPKTFYYNGNGIELSDDIIRLMVAVFADGSFRSNSKQCYMGLTKERKIKRISMLLNKCNIEYRVKNNFFIFDAPFNCKHYPSEWYNMNNHQLQIVLDEMKHWDGSQFNRGHLPSFTTINKEDADFIQFAYSATGNPAYIVTRDRIGETKIIKDHEITVDKLSYSVASGKKSKIASLKNAWIEPYKTKDGFMYCFTMPSSMWVMRRNDKIIVTGNTFDAERASIFGNKPKQMLVYRARYGEDAFNKTIKFSKAGIPLVIIDSVPSMIPKDDAEKVLKSAEKDSIEEQRIGGTARLMNKYLPTVEEIIEVTGTTVVFINQVRDKMNAMMFGEKTDTPGGHKLKHACSIRIQVARKSWIEIPNKDPRNSATNKKVGLIMKCKIVKSKVSNPMGECEIPLFFDRGFVSFDDVKPIRDELMEMERKRYDKRLKKNEEEFHPGLNLDDWED